MRQSGLELVNYVLSAGDAETVSTIGETEESEQVQKILNRAYIKLEQEIDWLYRRTIVKLDTASGTDTTWDSDTYPDVPWAMKIPTNVESVHQVYYASDTTKLRNMKFVTPEWFQWNVINQLNFSTDGDPIQFTSWDENYIVFNNFDSSVENQLTSSNSEALVTKFPGTDIDGDTDTIDMPDRFFTALTTLAITWYYEEVDKNIPVADRKRKDYVDARSKLLKWGRRNKPFLPYYHGVDMGRRIPARAVQTIRINDLGPE